MAGWIEASDQSSEQIGGGLSIGGLSFGSAGSGRHTANTAPGAGSIPPWLVAAVLGAVALVVVVGLRRKR